MLKKSESAGDRFMSRTDGFKIDSPSSFSPVDIPISSTSPNFILLRQIKNNQKSR